LCREPFRGQSNRPGAPGPRFAQAPISGVVRGTGIAALPVRLRVRSLSATCSNSPLAAEIGPPGRDPGEVV